MLLVAATVAAPERIVVVVLLPGYARQCAKLSALPAKKEQRNGAKYKKNNKQTHKKTLDKKRVSMGTRCCARTSLKL